jgi:transporter family-2 protein
MTAWLLLPTVLGAAMLCQAILNRQFSDTLGLANAALVNATVFFAATSALWLATRVAPASFPGFFKPGAAGFEASPALLAPGLCGFLLVVGAPMALHHIGPSRTFVLLVGSQILLSVVADQWLFGADPSWTKWLGAGLALAGAVLVAR